MHQSLDQIEHVEPLVTSKLSFILQAQEDSITSEAAVRWRSVRA
jgi:hypothetical protein